MTVDPLFAKLLLRRARQTREMALEVDLLQHDPSYKTMRDRTDHCVAK